jgi:L-2-hydroxycarboxylate dehydrogenase (NAD+)
MKVPLSEFEELTREVVHSYGYSAEETGLICDVLLYAQLRGNSQGVVKLIGPGIPRDPEEGEVSLLAETEVSALIDGARKHAMVVVSGAVDLLLAKLPAHGIAVVGVNQIGTSSGALGYFARRIAEKGYVGIVVSGAPPKVAPEGSYQPLFGTNPLAISVPSTAGPVTLDMATAAISLYGVIEADTAGRQLPPDCAYDDQGEPTTDASRALGGALRTFDRGPKSSGLSFMVQALAGPLVAAAFAGIGDVTNNWGGHLLIGIDPDLLGGRGQTAAGISEMSDRLKAAARLPDVDDVYAPGERGDRQAAATVAAGEIEVEEQLLAELRSLARESSLTQS